jgi:hypothetical protein
MIQTLLNRGKAERKTQRKLDNFDFLFKHFNWIHGSPMKVQGVFTKSAMECALDLPFMCSEKNVTALDISDTGF